MARKKKGSKRRKSKGRTSKRLPSWNEVRAGLVQNAKVKLLFLLGRIYVSKATPRSVKMKIVAAAKIGVRQTVRKIKSKTRRKSKGRKGRTAKQRAATRKLVAFNKRRRR